VGQRGHVHLRRAHVPEQLQERFPLRVLLHIEQSLRFVGSDGPPGFELQPRPLLVHDDGPRQPTHAQSEAVQPAHKDVRRDRAALEHLQDLLGAGFNHYEMPQRIERGFIEGAFVSLRGAVGTGGLGLLHRVHDVLPGALTDLGIARDKIRAGHVRIEGGLIRGFVAGVEQAQGFGFVGRAEALLFAGLIVFEIEAAIAAALIHAESLLHNVVGYERNGNELGPVTG
jgi:hypothetical protein